MGDFRRRLVPVLYGFLLLLTSCESFISQKPSIVLILLESFSEKDYLCSDSRSQDTMTHLEGECEQFIRFTHVFAPTPMTQPNLATLLSGMEVQEHGVRYNGPLGLSSRYQTLAESALNVNMRTGFFSGGVPLIEKFGISQGIEKYEDSLYGSNSEPFQPIKININRALAWIDSEVKSSSFFMTLYAPDLLYKNLVTYDHLDDERPVTRTSTLQEVHESLDYFVGELKKRKRWKNTHFIVLGLSGPKNNLQMINPLGGRSLHVPLQIKLATKIKSNLTDLNTELVSFSKLGRWIEKMIFHKSLQGELIFSPTLEENFIPQQDYWRSWKGLSSWPTLGLRKKQYLFTFNPGLQVFDGFYDKDEVEPMLEAEAGVIAEKFEIKEKVLSYFPDHCWEQGVLALCSGKGADGENLAALSMMAKWSEQKWQTEAPTEWLSSLISQAMKTRNQKIMQWLAWQALEYKNWTQLFEIGKAVGEKSWMLVARLNLREDSVDRPERCLRYFVRENKVVDDFYKHCEDSALRRVVEGLSLLKNKQKAEDGFWGQISQIKKSRRAKNLNLEMLFINDVAGAFDFAPSLAELYFFLPENSEYRKLIDSDES